MLTLQEKDIVIRDYTEMVTEATEGIKEYFHTMPKASVIVKAVPEYSENSSWRLLSATC